MNLGFAATDPTSTTHQEQGQNRQNPPVCFLVHGPNIGEGSF